MMSKTMQLTVPDDLHALLTVRAGEHLHTPATHAVFILKQVLEEKLVPVTGVTAKPVAAPAEKRKPGRVSVRERVAAKLMEMDRQHKADLIYMDNEHPSNAHLMAEWRQLREEYTAEILRRLVCEGPYVYINATTWPDFRSDLLYVRSKTTFLERTRPTTGVGTIMPDETTPGLHLDGHAAKFMEYREREREAQEDDQ